MQTKTVVVMLVVLTLFITASLAMYLILSGAPAEPLTGPVSNNPNTSLIQKSDSAILLEELEADVNALDAEYGANSELDASEFAVPELQDDLEDGL